MKSISAALAIAAFAVAGAAFACEDHANHAMSDDDSLAFASPNASQKPVVVMMDNRGTSTADKPVAVKKAANKPDTAAAAPKTATTRVASKCASGDC